MPRQSLRSVIQAVLKTDFTEPQMAFALAVASLSRLGFVKMAQALVDACAPEGSTHRVITDDDGIIEKKLDPILTQLTAQIFLCHQCGHSLAGHEGPHQRCTAMYGEETQCGCEEPG